LRTVLLWRSTPHRIDWFLRPDSHSRGRGTILACPPTARLHRAVPQNAPAGFLLGLGVNVCWGPK
jgi:hypothetical protein